MKKNLPQPKKTLKTFILENDAKITDKTAAKITITTAFIAINIAALSHDANAKGHSNHNSHQNRLNVEYDYGTGYHVGNNFYETEYSPTGIPSKSVQSAHGNHYNHSNGGGQGGGCGDTGQSGSEKPSNNPEVGSQAIMPSTEMTKLREEELN